MASLLNVCSCLLGDADSVDESSKPREYGEEKKDTNTAEQYIALGDRFRKGVDGGVHDDAEAARMYEAAAELGDAVGAHKLAWMYANGRGVQADLTKAVHYYRIAAEQGLLASQNNLGAIFRDGRGVPRDYEQARVWFEKAAAKGLAQAMCVVHACAHARRMISCACVPLPGKPDPIRSQV